MSIAKITILKFSLNIITNTLIEMIKKINIKCTTSLAK